MNDLIYKNFRAKIDAVVRDVAERQKKGPAGSDRYDLDREERDLFRGACEGRAFRTRF